MASIEKRGENSYRLTACAGYYTSGDKKGQKIRKRKIITLEPGLTDRQIEKELERQAALFDQEVQNGTCLDGANITLSEFVDRWLSSYAEKELEPKTVFRYKEMLTSRILPVLGHIKLSRLQPVNLLDFYSNLAEVGIRLDTKYVATEVFKNTMDDKNMNISKLVKASGISDKTISNALKGMPISRKSVETISKALETKQSLIFAPHGEPEALSSRTVLHHHRLISSILTSAVQWQVIISSPADRVKAPRTDKKAVQHYDEDQTKALLEAIESEEPKYKAMVMLAVFTGFRLGELMGLSWDNLNFENNTIEVVKASQYITGMGNFEKRPKNETSIRKISIPAPVMSLLKEYRKWWLEQQLKCGDLWQKSDRLFTTWNGLPMFTYSLTNWFPEFLQRHNLPKITPHGLRHTMASLLDSQGMEISAISKRLGHARISTTSDIYTHVFKKADVAASNLLEKALLPKKEQEQLKQG